MRNLKRVLSLAMASIMLVGMMMVGASAVDFPDSDKIQNVDAVNSLVALGVIKGKDDGNFDPEGIVTRAEMAKMICVSLNGGKDPQLGNASTDSYTDTVGHWASAYIEYCTNLGIVAGKGDGKFDPNATVTGVEAAKMMLVAMNYDSNVFGFTGGKWDINVGTEANKAGLYEKLPDLNPSEGLTRDAAAQLIWNGIQAKTMTQTWNQNMQTGEITQGYTPNGATLLASKFHAATFVGTFEGNYDTGATTTKGEVKVKGNLTTDETGDPVKNASFPAEIDIANIGEEYTVLFKDANGGKPGQPDKKDTIYGVYNNDNTTIYETTKGDIQDSKSDTEIKFDDTKYDVADTVKVVTNYAVKEASTYTGAKALQAALKSNSADTIKFTTDAEGDIAMAYVVHSTFEKVVAINSETISLSASGKLTIDDENIYDDASKDDIVKVTKMYSSTKDDALFVVEKADLLEGEVTSFVNGDTVYVDGDKITRDANATDVGDYEGGDALTNAVLGETYEFIMYGNRFVAFKAVTEASKDYAVVIDADNGTPGSSLNAQKVQLLLADGTKATYTVHKDSTVGNGMTTDVDASNKNVLVSYKVQNDGSVKMTALTNDGASNFGAYKKATKSLTTNTDGTKMLASDAVGFVYFDNDPTAAVDMTWKVYSANSLADMDGETLPLQYNVNSNGKVTVFAMQADAKPSSTADESNYLYITAAPQAYKDGDDTYTKIVGYNGEEEVTLKIENDVTADVKAAKGTFVKYTELSDGTSTLDSIILDNGRVNDYDEARRVIDISGGVYAVSKEVKIINVNTADVKAGDNAGISEADPVNVSASNVVYVLDTIDGVANTLVAIFVDDDGDIQIPAKVITTDTAANINAALAKTDVTMTGTLPSGVTVPNDRTLTVKTLDAAITVNAKGTLVVTDAATDAQIDGVTGSAGSVLTLKAASSDNVSSATDFYAENGTAVTGAPIPAGTYTYYAANSIKGTHAAGWYTAAAVDAVKAA